MQMPDYGTGQGANQLPGAEAFSSSNMAPFLTKLFQVCADRVGWAHCT